MYQQDYNSYPTFTIIYHISIDSWDRVGSSNCLYKICDTGIISSV